MLTALSIRDVVLIERLDLTLGPGLTALTGETGAGKSILLDSLGLALGARADAGLVRAGAAQATASACFALASDHPARALLAEQGIEAENEIVLRRSIAADGRSRAFIDDQPVGVALLRRVGALLAEVQGQHEQMGLADPATQAAMLDTYGVDPALRAEVADRFASWRAAAKAAEAARADMAAAERDRDWLRHAAEELAALRPAEDEEASLAAERLRLQRVERRFEAIAAALAEIAPQRGRGGPGGALRAATRALAKLGEDAEVASVLVLLDQAEAALAEAETLLGRVGRVAAGEPRLLEQAEERLFALRAAARKHAVSVAELPSLARDLAARLDAIHSGAERLAGLETAARAAEAAYRDAAARLTRARWDAAARLERAVARELPPLRLDRARFSIEVAALPEASWGAAGADVVRFLIATNPGQPPGPLARVASGGELSRLLLALRVVLAGTAPTLIFDEVDSGVGGATAAAVGERLARLAGQAQVLVVTHSPQCAARAAAHWRVVKRTGRGRTVTLVEGLDAGQRREEVARMLAGETVTEAARAAAEALLEGA